MSESTDTVADVAEIPAVFKEINPAELKRPALVGHNRNFSWITNKICGITEEKTPNWWWICFCVAGFIASFTVMGLAYQVSTGVGVWGLAMDREDLQGDKNAWGFKVDFPNDPLDAAITYIRIGDGFDPSLGFVPRKGIQKLSPSATYMVRPDWSWLRSQNFQLFTEFVFDLDGELESYRVFTAPLNLRFESGDRFEFNIVPTGDRPLEPFEIGGVVIPAGDYEWVRYRVEIDAAPKRPVSGRVSWWFGTFYDGTLDQIQGRVNWNPSATFNLELGAERNIAHLGGGSFTQDLASLRAALNISPDLVISSFLQYDNESDSFGTNTRMRWTFNPLGELFVIWNTNIVDPFDRWRTDTNQLSVKVRYTLRR